MSQYWLADNACWLGTTWGDRALYSHQWTSVTDTRLKIAAAAAGPCSCAGNLGLTRLLSGLAGMLAMTLLLYGSGLIHFPYLSPLTRSLQLLGTALQNVRPVWITDQLAFN